MVDEQTRKVYLKMHQIARFRVRGHKDGQIAQHFGLSLGGFARIVGCVEYKEIEQAVLKDTLSKMDRAGEDELTTLRNSFGKEALPEACKALIETVKQDRDLKAKLAAAAKIFEIDPTQTFGQRDANGTPREALPQSILDSRTRDANELRSKLVN